MALESGGPAPPLHITPGTIPPGPYPIPDPDLGAHPAYGTALAAMPRLGNNGDGDPWGPMDRWPGGDGPRNWFPPPGGGGDPYGPPVQKPPPVYPGMDGGPAVTHGVGWELGGGAHSAARLVGQVQPNFTGDPDLNADFVSRLSALRNHVLAAGGDIGVFSGSRSPERQQQLYQAALQKYGTDAAARKIVAPPGSSLHDPNAGLQYGFGPGALSADLHGHLAMAHRIAPTYGLEFSRTHPWHIQVAGL